jgi:hypothetical protein
MFVLFDMGGTMDVAQVVKTMIVFNPLKRL